MKSGHQLAPEGKILSGRKGVTDAPLAESKEAIAGYWFIYADSLEEAVEIAKGNPGLEYGQTIEVRPGGARRQSQAERSLFTPSRPAF